VIRYTTLALAISLLTAGCSRSSEAPPSDTATPAPGSSTSPAAAPVSPTPDAAVSPAAASPSAAAPPAAAPAAGPASAPPSGPIPLPVTAAVALVGATPTTITFDGAVVVDPAVRFQVDVAVPLVDARLALVDSADAMVAAVESHEIGASWSRFTLAPGAPLRPGTTYSLRLDGAAEREAHDSDGRAYQIVVWRIRTSGEPPPPEPPAPKKRRGR